MGCLIHKWDGCKCTKCGKTRDSNHIFVWSCKDRWNHDSPKGCYQVCSKCGKVVTDSFSEHEMKIVQCFPTCQKCGYKGRPVHVFARVKDKCLERCTVCGEEKQLNHFMRGRIRDGHCEQYCILCGHTIEGHKWYQESGCKCEICGQLNPDGQHSWKTINEGDYTGIKVCRFCGARDESEKMLLSISRMRDREKSKQGMQKRSEMNKQKEAEKRDLDRERDEAMLREDSMSEMRSVGIKC